MPSTREPRPIAVDRVLCSGHGVCAQTLPGLISLDEWGYPVVSGADPVDPQDAALAIKLCPARALYLR